MKIFEDRYTYRYSFPIVSLAYFLRYPNPYARHVLSTDVLERYIDPNTHRLHSTRLHLKKANIPLSSQKLSPNGIGRSHHSTESCTLETTLVDPVEG